MVIGSPALIDGGPRSSNPRSASDSSIERKERIRPLLPPQPKAVNVDETNGERKRARDESSAAGVPRQKQPDGLNSGDGEKRERRHDQVQLPAYGEVKGSAPNDNGRV